LLAELFSAIRISIADPGPHQMISKLKSMRQLTMARLWCGAFAGTALHPDVVE
jgi:hypothetical protein